MNRPSWLPNFFFQTASKSLHLKEAISQPTLEWQVNGFCNYDCVYCIQSPKFRRGTPSPSMIDAIVTGFSSLPGTWEIKMSGGEPFAFKGFMEQVIPDLMRRTHHLLSVLTNFSAPRSVLQQFSELTRERLRITSASFHPDTADLDDFIAKAVDYREFRQRSNPDSSFVVNVVMVPGKVKNHYRYRDLLAAHDLRYFPQLMKTKGGVFPYRDDERAMIEDLTGGSHDPMLVNRAPNYHGLYCDAGVRYFIVDQTGEAFTCRTGKRFSSKIGQPINDEDGYPMEEPTDDERSERSSMGSFVRGDFRLRNQGGPCPYSICPCTVPANRGIVHIPDRTQQIEMEHDAR